MATGHPANAEWSRERTEDDAEGTQGLAVADVPEVESPTALVLSQTTRKDTRDSRPDNFAKSAN